MRMYHYSLSLSLRAALCTAIQESERNLYTSLYRADREQQPKFGWKIQTRHPNVSYQAPYRAIKLSGALWHLMRSRSCTHIRYKANETRRYSVQRERERERKSRRERESTREQRKSKPIKHPKRAHFVCRAKPFEVASVLMALKSR